MANVKDLLVNGSARVIGTIYGNATSANKLNTNAGSASQPVYFSNGIPVAITGTISNNAATATKATQDSAGQQINTTYIKGLSVSGRTITYTKGDGTTGTITTQDNNTTYSAGTGLSLSGTTFNHKNSVTAGTAQGDANKTLTFGGTFTIPTITYDAQGHITSKGTTTMTMPANPNVDTKVTQNAIKASDYTNWRPLIWGASSSGTEGFNPSTVTDGVYTTQTLSCQPSSGTIRATTFKGSLSGNASTATKATQDDNGQVISSTYLKKRNLIETSQTSVTSGSKTGTSSALILYGATYGNDPAYLKTSGKMSYGDPGPQIQFSADLTSGQRAALIYTDHDAVGDGISLSLVTNENDAWFIAPHIKALTGFIGNLSGNASTATNADKLDGYHESSFLRYSGWWNTDSGNNVNDASGMIFAYNKHGLPGSWGIVTTFDYSKDSAYRHQIYGDCANNNMYFRTCSPDTGGWHEWRHLLDSNNYTSYTVTKTGSGASGNWGISITGNAATASKVKNKLTVGSKTYDGSAAVTIAASDLGLASAMLFLGTTTTAITDGAKTNPIAIGGSNKTVTAGNVVLYGSKEFVWTGSAWEELGNEGSYKIVQAAVGDPSASGTSNTFIATISQDSNGKITATKKTVAVTNNAPTLSWGATSTIGTVAGTNLQVKMPANPNTWRGIQNNLTSDSTTDSLSAAQGKVLKGLVDGKAAANHTHNYAGSSSAGGTANAANKVVSRGNHTETASGTTANSPTTGMLDSSGMYMTQTYNDSATPANYGNIINLAGNGTGQLMCEWSGSDNTLGHLYYRSHRDTNTGGWSNWGKVAFVTDNVASATKATKDSAGQQINTTYIKGLSVSGRTITYTKGDGSTGTITTQDTNTTYGVATTSANGLMSSADKSKLDGIAAGANNYSHPTSSGNKHIPAGGSSGQILRWSADGTAVWGADTNTWRGIQNNLTSDSTTDSLAAAQGKALKALIDGKAASSHTHNYAGSSSAGGSANSAVKLDTATAGDSNTPVYFANGKPVACSYKLEGTIHSYKGSLASGGWKKLSNRSVSGPYLSIAYNKDPASWNSGTYSASLVFGNEDTRGLLDCSYNIPVVTFGGSYHDGSTDDNPNWYFKLSGNTKQTYTFPTRSTTLCASDGSNASGTWRISITGSSASCTGNAATTTKLATARTITLSGAVTGSASFDGSNNITINTSNSQQTLPYSSSTSQLFVTSKANQASYTLSNFVDNAVYHVYVNGFKIPNSEYTVSSSGVVTLKNPPELANQEVEIVANYTSYVTTDSSINNSSYLNYYRQATAPSNTNALWLDTSTTTSSSSFTPKLYDGGKWNAIGGADTAVLDARYVLKSGDTMTGNLTAPKVYGAVWNDYAEFRTGPEEFKPGQVVCEVGDDTVSISTKRLQRGCSIISDTFGFAIGETDKAKCPLAVSGRVLAYGYEPIEEFKSHIGYPVCSGPNGTVSIMTDEEEEKYPSRIIGIISAVPEYEEWGTGKVKVDGRIWIKLQ